MQAGESYSTLWSFLKRDGPAPGWWGYREQLEEAGEDYGSPYVCARACARVHMCACERVGALVQRTVRGASLASSKVCDLPGRAELAALHLAPAVLCRERWPGHSTPCASHLPSPPHEL